MARLVARFGITRYEADEFYRMALESYEKHDMEEAMNNINAAIETNPHRAEYYAARGFFRMQDGHPPERIHPDLDDALSRNPYEALANYSKGVIAYQAEDYITAREYFMQAWAALPERAETLYYLALIAHRLQENAQAIDWMQQALEKFNTGDGDRAARRRARQAEKWLDVFREQQDKLAQAEHDAIALNPDRPQ